MKKCSKCNNILPINDFYKHPNTPDGHMYICKQCKSKYDKSEKGKLSNIISQKKTKSKYPIRNRAGNAIRNAVRYCKVEKSSVCELCGVEDIGKRNNKRSTIQAHHWSYKEEHWLDVVWCCRICHDKIHNNLRKEMHKN